MNFSNLDIKTQNKIFEIVEEEATEYVTNENEGIKLANLRDKIQERINKKIDEYNQDGYIQFNM